MEEGRLGQEIRVFMAMLRNLRLHFAAIACAGFAASVAFSQTNAQLPITHEVTVQLVQVTTTDGSEAATVFGTPTQQESIENQVDNIWGQCGISVNFLPTINTYASDFAYDGRPVDYSQNSRPNSHLSTVLVAGNSAGVANTNSSTVAAYFTSIAPGFAELPTNTAAGLARVDDNGTALAIGQALITFPAGRAVVALVFAHELGHNLGLNHVAAGSANLLASTGGTSQQLTQSQCSTVFTNDFGRDGFELLVPVTLAACDFDGDGQCDLTDLDYIYEGFGTDNALLNMDDSDGLNTVNNLDIIAWLGEASNPSNPYKANAADTYILGDINLDGDVDSTDLGTLLVYYDSNSGQGWDRGDFDGNDMVDDVDLGLLLNNFAFSSSAAVAAVPEPDALGLCVAALFAMVLVARRRA